MQQQSAPHWAICPNCDFVFYNNPAPCVSLLFYQDGQVLLARRGIEPQKGKWDLVGGFINTGESGEAAAVREAKEETQQCLDQLLDHFLLTFLLISFHILVQ